MSHQPAQPMRPRRTCFTAIVFLLLLVAWAPSLVTSDKQVWNETALTPVGVAVPSLVVNVDEIQREIFEAVDIDRLEDTVRELSLNHPRRIWYPLDKAPSDALRAAWEYVDQKIAGISGGELHFERWGNQSSLVCEMKGTASNNAPILVVGTIASPYSPGANGYGASVAAVLEVARVLSDYSLTNDVLFVLTNTITGYYATGELGNLGVREVLKMLYEDGRPPAALFWFSLLLNRLEVSQIAIRSYYNSEYGAEEFGRDLALRVSELSGAKMTVDRNPDNFFFYKSGAYDGATKGIPSFSIGQMEYEGISGSEYDSWNVVTYSYAQLTEATGIVASIVWYLGKVNTGDTLRFEGGISLPRATTRNRTMPLTAPSTLILQLSWTGEPNIRLRIVSPEGVTLHSQLGSGYSLSLQYKIPEPGQYHFMVDNLGNTTAVFTYAFSAPQDFDADTLDDTEEFALNTDAIAADTDADWLNDAQERSCGTNPRNPDSDKDGVLDGIEVLYGSNPLMTDTDGDGLSDGFETGMGLSPISKDTDKDGVEDKTELDMGLNPLDHDTDGDGLTDGLELFHGSDPMNRDTDDDGLSDLFEVLNGLSPHSTDTDGDGIEDLREVEMGMQGDNTDSDGDLLPDYLDWMPTEHWLFVLPHLGGLIGGIALLGWLVRKKRSYDWSETQ
ncbi:MAG: hypothetical protein HXY34_02860 [Candidatus Thorarchaeota archaeon]|nr:hypothetical protein [Candidatus Thorarchaeota archaeon]